MTAKDYDEEKALSEYVSRYWHRFLTKDERREYDLVYKRGNSVIGPLKHADLGRLTKSEQLILDNAVAEIRSMEGRLRQRVRQCIMTGAICVNRCDRCSRIVRTPDAQQCLWCGHDWHRG